MTGSRITLLGSQHEKLTEFLEAEPDGHERAAIVLFRRLHIHIDGLPDSDRFIAQEVILFEADWINSSSPTQIDFKLTPFCEIFRRCEEQKLVFGFIHCHTLKTPSFSATDDENESVLVRSLRNRNGNNISFVSMLWAGGQWIARTRSTDLPNMAIPVRHILVLGKQITLYGHKKSCDEHRAIQARQTAAFGEPFTDILQSLRVAVVGNGGTGSAFATLGARAGIGEIILIDKDPLDESNLNRVRGLVRKNVGQAKSSALKGFIDEIGLSVKVAAIPFNVDLSPLCVDALACCDVIIGCTDDYAGREVMNTAVYAYAQPLIDIGLGGKVDDGKDGHPFLRYHYGRISTILPEQGQCLFCQEVIKDEWIHAQLLRRDKPDISEEELKERYLEDGAIEAPGVGPFTSASADFALATLFDLIKPFRKFPQEIRRDMYFVDFVKMTIQSRKTESRRNCPYCISHNYLLLKESCRLNRPFLGKRNEFT